MAHRILIIDDDRMTIALIQFALKERRYEVVTAADGVEGLAEVRRAAPALIVLDVQMPRMSGFEFMNELKALAGGAAIPVVMLTANDNMQDIFFAEGVKGYFVKPIDPRRLEAKIREVLGITAA